MLEIGTYYLSQSLQKQTIYLLAMAVAFYDLNSDAGLKNLDDYLLTRSYITG